MDQQPDEKTGDRARQARQATEGKVTVEIRTGGRDEPDRAAAPPPPDAISPPLEETGPSTPDESDRPPADVAVAGPADDREALARERDELRDRLLRTAAEFDNYRKRVDRERREQADWAAADLVLALLPVVDDLERALGTDPAGGAEGLRKGVELIHRQVLDVLSRRGVVPIDAVGSDFDPRYHEAVLHEECPDHRPGEVIAEFRRGYRLGDRLLRASMVKVARA